MANPQPNSIRVNRIIVPMLILGLVLTNGFLLLSADGEWQDSGQRLGADTTYDMALADLDSDGDLDIFAANNNVNRVWINQAGAQGGEAAVFVHTGQALGIVVSRGVSLADLDGNQTIDAFIANTGDNETWINNGKGQLSLKQKLASGTMDSRDAVLAHLNGDIFPDAFVANNGANEVWLNNGDGTFFLAQDALGLAPSNEVALGDINGDGAIDAYVANGYAGASADELWINAGNGHFTASAQSLDIKWNEGVALGDLDGDGDLDLFLATWFGSDGVWLNDGGVQGGTEGDLFDSGQMLSGNSSTDIALADVDGDDDLDAIVSKFALPNEVWLNDGSGQFSNSGQTLDDSGTYEVAAGDIDLDGDPDLVFGNLGANQVWLLGGLGLPRPWFDIAARENPGGLAVYPWAQPSDASLPVALGYAAPGPLQVQAEITSDSGVQKEFVSFAAGQTTGQLSIPNPQPSLSSTVTIELSIEPVSHAMTDSGSPVRAPQKPSELVNPVTLVFLNDDQAPQDCLLCTADWMIKLMGFEPTFWKLHHVGLADLRESPVWPYFTGVFRAHQSELVKVLITHPAILWQTFDVLQLWTPDIVAADNGQGNSVFVSTVHIQQTEDLLQAIASEAGPQLQQRLALEIEILDPPSFTGLSMDSAMTRLQERIRGQLFLPMTVSGN